MSGRNNKEVLEWAMKTRRPKSRKHENSEETSKGGDSSKTPEQKRPRKKKAKSSGGPTNPFLIFFLRMRSKKPNEHVTTIAKAAGKQWAKMTPDQRQKYVKMASVAKKKRVYKKKKRDDDPE
ncbi:uncharacterized protein LOC141526625 [Cotesia typhae]|uniref:uncharacterized protein LOC141526625 n=1 Tax=Cotesia typhae TaxID=2053667 RepID=UPI003D68AE8F